MSKIPVTVRLYKMSKNCYISCMISDFIMYIFLFCSLYFEIFILFTYIQKRHTIKTEYLNMKGENWPTATVIVPCFNESFTAVATVNSILAMDYPKEKLNVMVVDDGSTDNTLETLEIFRNHPQVQIHSKQNGGKHSALNFAIENSKSDIIGCLDADSFVDRDALKNMIPYFENPEIMAVVPAIEVVEPKNLLQKIQKIEYGWGIFTRKIFSYLNALHVTPGPFTMFRRNIFEKIGKYKHAHQTEDMEMALRMQKNNYKIANSHRSFVFTVTPNTAKTLYKQRLRWTYGFLKNIIDYKNMLFKKKYGDLGILILPFALFSVFIALYFVINFVIMNLSSLLTQILKIKMVGISFGTVNVDWFYLNTSLISIITMVILLISIILVVISRGLAEGKFKMKPELFYFIFFYPIITPIWLVGAVFSIVFSKTMTWR